MLQYDLSCQATSNTWFGATPSIFLHTLLMLPYAILSTFLNNFPNPLGATLWTLCSTFWHALGHPWCQAPNFPKCSWCYALRFQVTSNTHLMPHSSFRHFVWWLMLIMPLTFLNSFQHSLDSSLCAFTNNYLPAFSWRRGVLPNNFTILDLMLLRCLFLLLLPELSQVTASTLLMLRSGLSQVTSNTLVPFSVASNTLLMPCP